MLTQAGAPPAVPTRDLAAEEIAHDIADSLMSPYCPGRSISSCPSGAARDLEEEILAQAQGGQTREEIEAALVARFGEDRVGSAYSAEVAVTALLAALVAIVVVLVAASRWKRGARSKATGHAKTAQHTSGDEVRQASRVELNSLDDALEEMDEF